MKSFEKKYQKHHLHLLELLILIPQVVPKKQLRAVVKLSSNTVLSWGGKEDLGINCQGKFC